MPISGRTSRRLRTAALTAGAMTALALAAGAPTASALGPDAIRAGFDGSSYGGNDDGTFPCVATNDEGGVPFNCPGGPTALPLPFPIDFYGTTYTSTFLNNNGNLTFDAPLATYTPFPILTTDRVMIAPFFADVDTRVGPTVTYGTGTVGGRPAFGVNWPGVGCFLRGTNTSANHFQVVLVDRSDLAPGDFDMEFNYDQIQWDAGTYSGGNASCLEGDAARAGFSNGSTTAFELAGSGVDNAFLDGNAATGLVDHSLNSSQPGRYVFRVRGGQPSVPPTVTGPTTVGGTYSDPIAPTVFTAADGNAAQPLTLTASGVPAGLTFTDNGDRTGTLSGAPAVAAGTYPVTISVSDGDNDPVTTSVDVVVGKEDCSLGADPVLVSSAAGPTTLTATLAEGDGTPGDRAGKTIVFTPEGRPSAAGTTDAAGVATASADLGAGVYAVDVAFAGDGFYTACAVPAPVLVTVEAAEAKATGGGWFSNGTGRTSFGLNAIADVTGQHGQLQLRTPRGDRFHGSTVSGLKVTGGTTATWSGTGRWNGVAGHRFTATVVDAGSSGAKKGDTISVVVRGPAGDDTVLFSTSGAQPLKGGNLKVR